jgi:hypothetical protein
MVVDGANIPQFFGRGERTLNVPAPVRTWIPNGCRPIHQIPQPAPFADYIGKVRGHANDQF